MLNPDKKLTVLLSLVLASQIPLSIAEDQDPPEVAIGERLFLETRFAHAYYVNSTRSDPALEFTLTTRDPLRGPFAAKTMNCRACHMVDEHNSAAGNRTYADYAHTSPVPARDDQTHFTGRNSMQLVRINPANKKHVLLHFDGEFNSMEDLVRATFTGRNFGWLPHETDIAIKHIARVIREDDGRGELAQEFGGSYRKVLTGTAQDIPGLFRLPRQYRVDVNKASDTQLFAAVARLVSAYVNQLEFSMDEQGNYTGSPYDYFLRANKLPQQPAKNETAFAYSQRLLKATEQLKQPIFITSQDGAAFATHQQAFIFGEQELAGMQLFFRIGNNDLRGGNCVSCHTPPDFSDFGFHNTGLTQLNYDEAHGQGSFGKLAIPGLKERNAKANAYLPATAKHPQASERFRRPIVLEKPEYVDLGMWNIFANPDFPAPQKKLQHYACQLAQQQGVQKCSPQKLLPFTIATFKTPVLRDLGHSDPYMHTGQFTNLSETVGFYIKAGAMARAGALRNSDKALTHINITKDDVAALVAFLNALNEDYD